MTPEYERAIAWIVRERGGNGWPPRDISKVSGWKVTLLVAHLFNRAPREVAKDIVEMTEQMSK